MAYHVFNCETYNPANANNNVIALNKSDYALYIQNGFNGANESTSNALVTYSHSCAHSTWGYNTRAYTIVMDNALRNAINSKINSGGLINLQNYVGNISEIQCRDMNGNNAMQVFGYICKNQSRSGSFDVNQYTYWEGDWPINYPSSVTYNYNIPGVGAVSDTVMLVCNGWYTRSPSLRWANYQTNKYLLSRYSIEQVLQPPSSWVSVPAAHNSSVKAPFMVTAGGVSGGMEDWAYYVINGIYSRNTGSRGCYNDNACDVLLDNMGNSFGGIGISDLNRYLGSGTGRIYSGNTPSITNNIILAITDINMVNNTITVKFAMRHDNNHSTVRFLPNGRYSVTSLRIYYAYPITVVHNITDTWGISFNNDSHFNPTIPNGSGPSTVIWDSATNSIALTAGLYVNNDNGYSKIISRSSGVLQCSCSNVNNTVRVNIGGYSVTVPSNVRSINIKILATNNGSIGYWTISPPGLGFSHNFTINYPSTENAPLVSFDNEIYTAIIQALNEPTVPFLFEMAMVNNEYSATVSGLVRCDISTKDGKKYYSISVYDVNGNFSSLLVKDGMVVTLPITVTVELSIVNNTILVKAGMASIGYTSTTIGDVPIDADAVAVLLPAVAVVSKNGAKIGYATTTVNQNSFAFSFSASKVEVEQTDDFVSHYLS